MVWLTLGVYLYLGSIPVCVLCSPSWLLLHITAWLFPLFTVLVVLLYTSIVNKCVVPFTLMLLSMLLYTPFFRILATLVGNIPSILVMICFTSLLPAEKTGPKTYQFIFLAVVFLVDSLHLYLPDVNFGEVYVCPFPLVCSFSCLVLGFFPTEWGPSSHHMIKYSHLYLVVFCVGYTYSCCCFHPFC